MNKNELFAVHRSSKRLNEGLEKTFGKKINLENFSLDQLQDARNKLRTQISQVRSESNFNENLENDAYHRAKFMLDAINAEISEREEFVVDVDEGKMSEIDIDLQTLANRGDEEDLIAALEGEMGPDVADVLQGMMDDLKDELASKGMNDVMNDQDKMIEMLWDKIVDEHGGKDDLSEGFSEYRDMFDDWMNSEYAPSKDMAGDDNAVMQRAEEFLRGEVPDDEILDVAEILTKMYHGEGDEDEGGETDDAYALASAGHGSDEDYGDFGRDESVQGDEMNKVTEGEIQQAQSIVTAKTMVDRVGRWIEELSGMENDTLLTLGDQIRDEMGQQQAKTFISSVAPAIQQALENLKATREALSSGVRTLTGEEQPAEMLGSEAPVPDLGAEMPATEPDMMNTQPAQDEFAAAEPAAGGAEAAGREQRESIQYQNRLLKVLAG